MSNNIVLTASQIQMVALAGVNRHLQFLIRNAKPQYGLAENTRWELQIEGALSEFALSKFLDKHWDGVGKAGGDDLGDEEVRTTKYHNGHLILHPRDKDEKRYWLVTGENGKYVIRGFMYAKEGKQNKYWVKIIEADGRDRSCFKIPQSDLTSPYLNG
jgi:hypothetical protein